MDYQLQVQPFKRKDGIKYKVIEITDIALRTQPYRSTHLAKKLRQAFTENKPNGF
tara:strand:- start:8287 stop:8451 length:165 start_codon:yes stop_codon:yes gene_type:complete